MLEHTSANLAENIRRIRERRGLTQQELSDLSGVPRPTIANLESGAANPTLSVLLRVADSLSATVEDLVRATAPRSTVHRAKSLPEKRRSGAAVRRLNPDAVRAAEFERIEIGPGAKLGVRAEAHGTKEIFACETGELLLSTGGDALPLGAGDVAVVEADQPRNYVNRGRRAAVAYRLVVATPAGA
jgi:transcriptional regulator with XRE-family HTH domain